MKEQVKTWGILIAILIAIAGGGWLVGRVVGWYTQKPDIPVAVSYRPSSVGKGYVVTFHNTSDKFLGLRAIFRNETLNQSLEKNFTLNPYGMQEYGWMEGWQFLSGETVTLIENDYRTFRGTIP